MSKFIGTNPNQAPSNADLGTASFSDAKDFLSSRGSNLTAISSVIPKTAVDVFVYDTRHDSDGGAWRKRCQHLTWYNEELNTPTRGSRREFPAVAVIVAEATNGITIYDADSPHLPMWMRITFTQGVVYDEVTCVTAMNGCIVHGETRNGSGMQYSRLTVSNLATDECRAYAGNGQQYNHGLINRNIQYWMNTSGWLTSLPSTFSADVVDVAVVARPNAPIEEASGLPKLTIAVAKNSTAGTAAGISIIKHDGQINNITTTTAIHHLIRNVDFMGERIVWTEGNDYDQDDRAVLTAPIIKDGVTLSHNNALPADFAAYMQDNSSTNIYGTHYGVPLPCNNEVNTRERLFIANDGNNTIFVANKHIKEGGYGIISEDAEAPDQGMIAYITDRYNTGWVPGGNIFTIMCDTQPGRSQGGSNLLPYGDLSSGTGWSFTGSAEYSISNQQLVDGGTQGEFFYSPYATVVPGKTYVASFEANGSGGTPTIWVENGSGSGYVSTVVTNSSGNTRYSMKFTVTGGDTTVRFKGSGTSWTGYYSWFEIAEADTELGPSNKTISPWLYGDIKKSAVASGSELMAYSGFAQSVIGSPTDIENYMRMGVYNAIGTSDFTISFWINATTDGNQQSIMSCHPNAYAASWTGPYISLYTTGRPYMGMYNTAGTSAVQSPYSSGTIVADGSWHQVVYVKIRNNVKQYVDGVFDVQNDSMYEDCPAFNYVTFGAGYRALNGSLALFKMSKRSMTPENIKKMYEDEKMLFERNAKCTLYGSDRSVAAIAYDKDTGLTHACTPSGRSVFKGLRRVDNTTESSTIAVSASNGLVVEE
jgi:hypothetical protein